MNAPILKFTCAGGPLDGIKFGPFPPAGVKDAPLTDKWLAEESTLCTAYRRYGRLRVPGQGRYRIRLEDDVFTATHVPSAEDVSFPPDPTLPAGPAPAEA